MLLTDFQIGDRCLFNFSSDKNIPVEIIAKYKKNVYQLTPENKDYTCDYASHEDEICGKYVFAAHVDYLTFVDRPVEEDHVEIDISTIL